MGLGAVLGLLRRVPWWVWLVAACLAWGAFQRHRALSAGRELQQAQAAAAADEARALRASITETERRLSAHQEIASAAQSVADRNARDAAGARAAADRVRRAAAAIAASAASVSASAPSGCPAAGADATLLAELLGRATERAVEMAAAADAARAAGIACERAYEALTNR